MLLQRLILDFQNGFSHDYMASADYDKPASDNGRYALAEAIVDDDFVSKQIEFSEVHKDKVTGPVEMIVFGRKASVERMAPKLRLNASKQPFRLYDVNITAWILVNKDPTLLDYPLLFVRASVAQPEMRVNRFVDTFVRELRDERIPLTGT